MGHSKEIHILGRAVIVVDGYLLVNKNQQAGFVFLPGGHVEHGESAGDAVARELQEELGLQPQVERYLGCFEYSFVPHNKTKCHTHEYNFVYQVTVPGLCRTQVPLSPEPYTVFEWVLLAQLDTIDFRPFALKKVLAGWLNMDHQHSFASSMEY